MVAPKAHRYLAALVMCTVLLVQPRPIVADVRPSFLSNLNSMLNLSRRDILTAAMQYEEFVNMSVLTIFLVRGGYRQPLNDRTPSLDSSYASPPRWMISIFQRLNAIRVLTEG